MSADRTHPLVRLIENGTRCQLNSPTAMPSATAFLWNPHMMLQANCRGYVVAQHLQPEPAKYAHAPNFEATTFMQPEQPWYAHHPGRFVYVKDEESGEIYSAPHEPVRRPGSEFAFEPGLSDIRWRVRAMGIELTMRVHLPEEDAVECWDIRVANIGQDSRRLSVYPAFSIGYMSWMNLSAAYEAHLGGIVARSVTPYQKVAEYERVRQLKDCTFLLHEDAPDAWEANRQQFEGEGGIARPDALAGALLQGGDARYETPLAALQYRLSLAPGEDRSYRFLFGPARDDPEIRQLRRRYFDAAAEWTLTLPRDTCCLGSVHTPDDHFNAFVNHWLPRQLAFHGDLDRLTTDPQTRNFLQDHMGMAYIDPADTRQALVLALEQQLEDGNLPDGVLLYPKAQLKYINQVPHTDHCVWLPVCLQAYLRESGDWAFLDAVVDDGATVLKVSERLDRAVGWLIDNRDARGLSYIAQGDWCDPMNMVGHRGKGVSGWLSMASAWACDTWADIRCAAGKSRGAAAFREAAEQMRQAVREHLWDGEWFARGITDDGRLFGVSWDDEGRIFLNPQSFALMSGAASDEQAGRLRKAVARELDTADGVMMLTPPFTRMHEDIGRVTQKSPGVSENGSVYNHAMAFWIFSLFQQGDAEQAYRLLETLIPGPDEEEYRRRGQLPVFLPNYYRGVCKDSPRTAGRSSQLVNTGTAAWVMRCLVEGLFGLRGSREGLRVAPQLPSRWNEVSLQRRYLGAVFDVTMRRESGRMDTLILLDGEALETPLIPAPEAGRRYTLVIRMPKGAE